MRTYIGVPPHTVLIDNPNTRRPLRLEPSLKLRNHSPTGFSWGYHGSGPSQLALAILLDFTRDEDVALSHYQDFKRAFIAGYGMDEGWILTEAAIDEWLASRKAVPA